MLKTGICRPADLDRERSVWGRRKRVSLGLLATAGTRDFEVDQLFTGIMAPLRLANGTYRTTARYRFSTLDPVVNRILSTSIHCSAGVTVHDWATSDGSAAMEWAASLARLMPRLRFCASDKLLSLVQARSPLNELYFCEPDGEPVQYVRRPFVLSFREAESAAYPVNRCAARWARRNLTLLRTVVPALSWPSALDRLEIRRGGWTFSQQPLLHPAVEQYAAANNWFVVKRHSVFDLLRERADVIRSMNILNRAYFSDERIVAGIRAACESLRPGGIWIVGRSRCDDGGTADADLLEKRDGRLVIVATVGEGSEIRALIEDLRAQSR